MKFAQRAKKIRQTISKNKVLDSKALIMKYQQEIQSLQEKLHEMEERMAHEGSQDIPEELTHQLAWLQEEKEKADERMENLLQEKLQLQKELERFRSFIIHPEDVKTNKISEIDYDEGSLRSYRRSIENIQKIKDEVNIMNNRRSNEGLQKVNEDDVSGNFSTGIQLDKNYGNSIMYNRKDSMLTENIERIPEMLESSTPFRHNESILNQNLEIIPEILGKTSPFISNVEGDIHADCFNIIDEQDKIIQTLHKALSEKEDEIGVLKDELTLCRNNLATLQRNFRKANK